MNKAKMAVKLLVTVFCIFIAFEILGVVVNIVVTGFQTSRALSHISSNNGSRSFNKSFVELDEYSNCLISQTVIVFSSKNKVGIEENIAKEFSDCQYEIITFDEAVSEVTKSSATTEYSPDYSKYKNDISFIKEDDSDNCYVLSVWSKAPFSHNLIGYLINYRPAEEKEL